MDLSSFLTLLIFPEEGGATESADGDFLGLATETAGDGVLFLSFAELAGDWFRDFFSLGGVF
jgi:hypothetical protein